MSFSVESFINSLQSGIKYIPNTLVLVTVPIALGIVFGTLIALAEINKIPVLNQIFKVFVTVYLGIPTVVALLIYNLLFLTKFDSFVEFFHIDITIRDINTIWIGIFALSLQTICIMSETIRGAFMSVDRGQWEAGYSVGLTKKQTTKRIIIPQMIPAATPNLVSLVIGLIKNSSIVTAIGVTEIMVGATMPANINYNFFEAYVAAALIYWILNIIIEFFAKKIEKSGKKYRGRLV